MNEQSGHIGRLLEALIRLLAWLPLPVLHATGRVLGRFAYLFPGRYRNRLRSNAALAGYGDPAFARRSAGEIGAMVLEMPRVWFRSRESIDRVVTDDWNVIEAAQARGRGIVFLTPHLGCFEITARFVAERIPMTVMFRPPHKRYLAPVLDAARNTSTLTAVPADSRGVRAFVRALRAGSPIGLLPDQAPSVGEGVWVPYFGRPAYTMTLPGKLASQTGASVLIAAGERLPGGKGWRFHLEPLALPLPEDAEGQAALINAAMEKMIRRFPEQYLWGYNRYKAPNGAPPRPEG